MTRKDTETSALENAKVDHTTQGFLYRGVSLDMHEFSKGVLAPKVTGSFEYAFEWGEPGIAWGGGATWGTSSTNAVVRHQLNQEGYPTSGISTTPQFERAAFYARLGGAREVGIVYKLDCRALNAGGVRILRVADFVKIPSVPADDEYVLVPPDGASIPPNAICEVVRVGTA